jgi:hypothetical protein
LVTLPDYTNKHSEDIMGGDDKGIMESGDKEMTKRLGDDDAVCG